ncbi:MAG: MBL fold metallo-hydrolase [bacterium]
MTELPGQLGEKIRKVAPERILLLLLLLLAVGLGVFAWRMMPQPLQVISFAVGDGDAFLIRSPSGRNVLIDGGSRTINDVGKQVLVPNLYLLGVRNIDAIIITHPDSDHLNGLPAVLGAIPVGTILTGDGYCDSTPFQQVLSIAAERKVPLQHIHAGAELNLGAGAKLKVLAPGPVPLRNTGADDNNNSVVTRLDYRNTRMLFTGDLETAGEQALLAQPGELRADVLKVAHHGSAHGSIDPFLDAVKPSYALLSAAGNADHPNPKVLARLRTRQITPWRTDILGRMVLSTTGNGWHETHYRNEAVAGR